MSKFHPETRCLELAERQHGVITTPQAMEFGLSRRAITRMISAGRWRGPYAGVLCPAGAVQTWELKLRAAVMSAGTDAVASHRAAARFIGLDGCDDAVIELTTPRRLIREGVVLHRRPALPPVDVTTVSGLRLTSPTRTVIDLGSVVSLDRLEAALDSALVTGVTSLPYLARRIEALSERGRSGVGPIKRLWHPAGSRRRRPRASWNASLTEG